MLPKWALNQVLRGCNKFQRTLDEFIASHWVQFTVWSTSIGRRFGNRSCSSPCQYGGSGDRTHRRSKSCWPGLQKIRSQVASSWCIDSGIALPTIWPDDIVPSPWMRTLIRCWFFPTLVKCECLCESLPLRPISIENDMLKSISTFLNQWAPRRNASQTILLLVVKPTHLFAVRSTNSSRIPWGYPITSQN